MTQSTILTIAHNKTEEWETDFDGDISQVKINGTEILEIHDLCHRVDKVSRQIRVMAVIATTTALAILVLVSLMFQYGDGQTRNIERIARSKVTVASRLYLLTGNIWTPKGWVVDPKWKSSPPHTPPSE